MRFLHRRDRDWQPVERPQQCSTAAGAIVRTFVVEVADRLRGRRRLLFLSDLHWAGGRRDRVDDLMAALNALEPDWIVFGGDLIRHLTHLPAALEMLECLRARRAKFAVCGNRERVHQDLTPEFWRDRFAGAGFRLLCNEAVAEGSLDTPVFGGLDDCRHGTPRWPDLGGYAAAGRLVMLVTHSPDAVGHASGRFVGHLVLAGHTHGGQIRLPGFGALYTSSVYGRQFDRGWYERQSEPALMCITAGLGVTGAGCLRRRLFCPPEVVVLELQGRPESGDKA